MELYNKKHIPAQSAKRAKKSDNITVSSDFLASSEEVFKKILNGETKTYTEAEMNALMERL